MTKQKDQLYVGFAERFTELFEEVSKPQKPNMSALARHLGCTPQGVGAWLKGTQFPRDRYLLPLATFLNTTPNYLKFGLGPKVQPTPPMLLMYVSSDREAVLLTHFREGTETGQDQLLRSAEQIEKKDAAELPAKPAASTH